MQTRLSSEDAQRHGPETRLGYRIKRVEQLLIAAKSRALREVDLTVPQYAVLGQLLTASGQSAAQLARGALVSPQTMATILTNLEAKGLIERAPSSVHARVLVCSLTPAGEDLATRADTLALRIEDGLADAFTRAEEAQFREFLARAEDHLGEVS